MYEGQFLDGKPDGFGRMIFSLGGGQLTWWKEGRASGYGILYYEDGDVKYEGLMGKDKKRWYNPLP